MLVQFYFFLGGIIDFDKQICINKLSLHNNLPIFCFKFVFHANIFDSKLIVKVKIESGSEYISSAYFLILENIMLWNASQKIFLTYLTITKVSNY